MSRNGSSTPGMWLLTRQEFRSLELIVVHNRYQWIDQRMVFGWSSATSVEAPIFRRNRTWHAVKCNYSTPTEEIRKIICKYCKGICTCHWCTPEKLVRIHCKANGNYNVAVRSTVGYGTCIVSADPTDTSQLWLKDNEMALAFDREGGFSLIHKDTGKAIRVAPEEGKQVLLADYDPSKLDDSVTYESPNKGRHYHTLYNGTPETVMHALRCIKCDSMEPCPEGEARVKENTLVVLMKDCTKKDDPASIAVNQLWKLTPARCCC